MSADVRVGAMLVGYSNSAMITLAISSRHLVPNARSASANDDPAHAELSARVRDDANGGRPNFSAPSFLPLLTGFIPAGCIYWRHGLRLDGTITTMICFVADVSRQCESLAMLATAGLRAR
ncbi:hypothetical protein JQ580_26815 [Bradyrhizobium japonicum]|uniref:hypothetical protein n=1 Tax=Bradyrhizobium japonicum TaxID=375 RepID=UPI001BAD5807|nr:hypothetical protein [Bradyrhizobium japonicum]MBR0994336.1 hypothetical protein [Bradyrhizobium japonicum]